MKRTRLDLSLRLSLGAAILFSTMTAATAQEICGLASVQYNQMHSDGFEGAQQASASASVSSTPEKSSAVTDAQAPLRALFDLGKPMGYAPKIAKGVAPTVTIISPTNGATLPGRTFEIRGAFTGPINTGVSINGSPARTLGNQWVAGPIRPEIGGLTIAAVATTLDGLTANATRNVSVADTPPKIQMIANRAGGMAPAAIGFRLRFGGAVSGNVQIDFDGDMLNDFDGPLAAVPERFTYAVPGFYTARVSATVDSTPVSADATVVVADVMVQRQRACSVYGALREALAADDLEASLITFALPKQEAFRPFFTSLGSNRPVFATRLGTIANGLIGLESAELSVLRIESGQPYGYPLGIASGDDGVWRITSF
ncbi:MAG: hypothetical protein SGI99_10370 [Pseudomonadota bacterium]|nr:hypothetical protein [Pseudomonadota bacterium]